MLYDWIKAFHVIAIIAWMAGMLYLPRLFVYHSDVPKGSIQSETFKIMERRLLKAIINPAMVLAWILGLILIWQGGWYTSGWLHAKVLLVLILSGRARIPVEDREGVRRRRECAPGEILPHDQRGSDGAHDRHRDPGDREAVLTSLWGRGVAQTFTSPSSVPCQ